MARPETVSGTIYDQDVTVEVTYYRDSNGNGEPDKDEYVDLTFNTDTTKGYFGDAESPEASKLVENLFPGDPLPTLEELGFTDVVGDEYAFDGWFDAEGNEITTVPAASMEVTAQWAADKNQDNVPDEDQPDAFTSITLAPYETTTYAGGTNEDENESGFPNLEILYTEGDRPINKSAIYEIYINGVPVGNTVDSIFKAVYWNEDTQTAIENDQVSDVYNATIVLGESAAAAFPEATVEDGYLVGADGHRIPARTQEIQITAEKETNARAVETPFVTYNVTIEDSELMVRPLTDPSNPEATYRPIVSDPTQIEDPTKAAAVIPANAVFYTNGQTERAAADPSGIALLIDTIQSADMDREGMLISRLNAVRGMTDEQADAEGWGYTARYFDLVDNNNGNAWVQSSEPTTVYLPYPAGTDANTEFKLYHFAGLHREEGLVGQDAADAINNANPIVMETENTEYGVKFVTSGNQAFSPFILAYRKDSGSPNPGGSGDGGHSSSGDDHTPAGTVDDPYVVRVHGNWVHMDPDNIYEPISQPVPEGATPVTNPEWHQWKFMLTNNTMLFNRWAYIRNPYAVGDQPKEGWFYFNNDGIMQYGWYMDQATGKWYYAHRESDGMLGTLIYGWHLDDQDGKWYYLDPTTGEMLLGWREIGGKWYYFNPTAPVQTWDYNEATGGWTFNGSTSRPYGSMYQNEMTPDGYQVDENGAWVQ